MDGGTANRGPGAIAARARRPPRTGRPAAPAGRSRHSAQEQVRDAIRAWSWPHDRMPLRDMAHSADACVRQAHAEEQNRAVPTGRSIVWALRPSHPGPPGLGRRQDCGRGQGIRMPIDDIRSANRRRCCWPPPRSCWPRSRGARPAQVITVYKSPSGGCCRGWVASGARRVPDLGGRDEDLRVCQAPGRARPARVLPYRGGGRLFVEGHVPAEDVKRLLRERPKARGIAVPGMPAGAPGMEQPDGRTQPYETSCSPTRGARLRPPWLTCAGAPP